MNPTLTKNDAIVGKRVFLRPPKQSDLSEYIALNRASIRLHRGLVSPPIVRNQFGVLLNRCRRGDSACFLICLTQTGEIVGSIDLSQIFRGNFQSAYVGYHVGERYARQGLMTEALQLALQFGFERLKLHRLEANIQPSNIASIALVRRAGFIREGFSRRYLKIGGRWRDHERWAIIAEDWKLKAKGHAATPPTTRKSKSRKHSQAT